MEPDYESNNSMDSSYREPNRHLPGRYTDNLSQMECKSLGSRSEKLKKQTKRYNEPVIDSHQASRVHKAAKPKPNSYGLQEQLGVNEDISMGKEPDVIKAGMPLTDITSDVVKGESKYVTYFEEDFEIVVKR